MTKFNVSKADLSLRDKVFCYLGVYSIKRNPYADTATEYGWKLTVRLWHPFLWIFLLVMNLWCLVLYILNLVLETVEDIRYNQRNAKEAYTDREQDD